MRNWVKYVGVMTALLLSHAVLAKATLCDRLATHPDDPDRNTAGLEREEIDFAAAEKACRAEIAADSRRARSQYHLARVLYYSGKVDESLPHLVLASDAGYRQAIFVLGYILAEGNAKHDDCRAGQLWLRGVALEHPWSGVHLVDKALAGRFAKCDFDLGRDDLERALRLAEDRVTLTASAGRIERIRARLDAAHAPAAGAN